MLPAGRTHTYTTHILHTVRVVCCFGSALNCHSFSHNSSMTTMRTFLQFYFFCLFPSSLLCFRCIFYVVFATVLRGYRGFICIVCVLFILYYFFSLLYTHPHARALLLSCFLFSARGVLLLFIVLYFSREFHRIWDARITFVVSIRL